MTLKQTLGAFTIAASLSAPAFSDVAQHCTALLADTKLTFVVPNSAGGGYDTYARALAPSMEAALEGLSVRVVNMPAGGGLAAHNYMINSDPAELRLIIGNMTDVATFRIDEILRDDAADLTFIIDAYDPVGIVHIASASWIGRAGLDFYADDLGKLVASEGKAEEAEIPLVLAGKLMGLDIDVIAGYEGTREMAAAVIRGEADVSKMSITTALKRAKDEAIDVVLIMSEGPDPDAPEVPYFTGEGSVVWEKTKSMDPEKAALSRDIASSIVAMRKSVRGIFMSKDAPQDQRECTAQILDVALADPTFIETVKAQGRPVAAMSADQARALADNLKSSFGEIHEKIAQFEALDK